jgi:hypothetical protein
MISLNNMKYNINDLNKRLKSISENAQELNEKFKKTVNHLADIDETNMTRELKYSMYTGLERLYQIENDKYHDLICKYSQSYLDICDFYVGENLPRDDFKKNLIDIYLFAEYVLKNANPMNNYDVD